MWRCVKTSRGFFAHVKKTIVHSIPYSLSLTFKLVFFFIVWFLNDDNPFFPFLSPVQQPFCSLIDVDMPACTSAESRQMKKYSKVETSVMVHRCFLHQIEKSSDISSNLFFSSSFFFVKPCYYILL